MSARASGGEGGFAPTVRLRHRDPQRCGSCGTRWSSRWFQIREWPSPLCADCNCSCKRRGVDHAACAQAGRLDWTAQRSDDETLTTTAPAPPDQLQLPL